MVDDEPYTLGLFDTSGLDNFDRLRPLSYPQTDVFLVCFSVVEPKSLENVREKWVPEIVHHCKRTTFLLVGTKIDLIEDTEIVEKLARNGQRPISTEVSLTVDFFKDFCRWVNNWLVISRLSATLNAPL